MRALATILLLLALTGCAATPPPEAGLERLPGADPTFGATMQEWQNREAQP